MNDPYVTAGKIRRALRDITEHYDAAGNPPKITDDSEKRGGDQARPPTDVHAIDCRADTIRHVSFWAQFILDEINQEWDSRTEAWVGTITTKVRGSNLQEMVTFVDRWALALAEQRPDDASGHREACREELTRDARRLKAVAHGTRTRSIEVGPCPEVVIDDDTETFKRCEGTVIANLTERDPDSDDDGLLPQHLTCSLDGTHTWQPWQWADIGKRIERMSA